MDCSSARERGLPVKSGCSIFVNATYLAMQNDQRDVMLNVLSGIYAALHHQGRAERRDMR